MEVKPHQVKQMLTQQWNIKGCGAYAAEVFKSKKENLKGTIFKVLLFSNATILERLAHLDKEMGIDYTKPPVCYGSFEKSLLIQRFKSKS